MERRLAAILAADMVGYSRLMAADETGTIERQKAHRTALIDPKIAQYGGRIVKTTGDGMLVEFPSVVDAVQCAVEIQRSMPKRESQAPDDQRIRYRIGINLGDIVIDGDDILGDGVNIAARLEALADPDGICVSQSVHAQVKSKLDLEFEDLGEQQVKNIPEPVRIYRVLLETDPRLMPAADNRRGGSARKWGPVAATVVVILVIGAAATWFFALRDPMPSGVIAETPPDKPSIAVLPFANLSGEAEQESFADGISEDLTTQLSRISGVFVISRTTAFQYKGRTANIRQLAQDLGVRYIIEGSVRRGGDQVRINAQLIDAATGGHLWANTFDGSADEVFALQDRINGKIVAALKVHLTPEEEQRLVHRGTENVVAYDAFLRGERLRLHTKTRSYEAAENEYNRAIELDPNFSAAYAAMSHVVWERARFHSTGQPQEELKRARVLAEKSIALGNDSLGHTMLARIYLWDKFDFDRSESEAGHAVAINPNNSEAIITLAEVLFYTGELQKARTNLENAVRINPDFPERYNFLSGQIYFHDRKYQDALESMSSFCKHTVVRLARRGCAFYQSSAYGHLGDIEAGHKIIDKLVRRYAGPFNWESLETTVTVTLPFRSDESHKHLMEGIRKVWPNR